MERVLNLGLSSVNYLLVNDEAEVTIGTEVIIFPSFLCCAFLEGEREEKEIPNWQLGDEKQYQWPVFYLDGQSFLREMGKPVIPRAAGGFSF